jgi:subtilisin family serine protease
LWRQGVLVCIAAGNEGLAMLQGARGVLQTNRDLSIADPGNLEEAITVGATHQSAPHTYGVSYFSSRGPTADGRLKPDLVAPGEQILSAKVHVRSGTSVTDLYVEMSGTSRAAPQVSGILAAFLSVRREFIGCADRVKKILLDTTATVDRAPCIQGRGLPKNRACSFSSNW